MKLFRFKHFLQGAAAALLLSTGSLPSSAGEPIQFSREKPRPAAALDEKGRLSNEAARQIKGATPSNPMDLLHPPTVDPGSRDPRDERRRRTADNEKKNWMFYDRGESRDRDEEDLGIRDYSIEKDDGTADSIFAPKANDARNVGRPKPPSSLSRLPGREQEEPPPAQAPEPPKETKRSGNDEPQRDRQTGGQLSKDLDLRMLLDDGKSSGADSADSAARNSRAAELAARPRDDQERRRADATTTTGPALDSTRTPGLADPQATGNSIGAPRATPSSFAPLTPRSSELSGSSSLDRNLGSALSSSRAGLDSAAGRSFNNPYSIYPPAMSTPYYDSRGANSGYGTPSSAGQRPVLPQNSAPSQSTWERSRIPRP